MTLAETTEYSLSQLFLLDEAKTKEQARDWLMQLQINICGTATSWTKEGQKMSEKLRKQLMNLINGKKQ